MQIKLRMQTSVARLNKLDYLNSEIQTERILESKAKWIFCDLNQVDLCLKVAASVKWSVCIILSKGEHPECSNIQQYINDDGSREYLFCEKFNWCKNFFVIVFSHDF